MKDLSNENVIHINKNGALYLQFRRLLKYKDILVHAYSLGTDTNFRTSRGKNKKQLSPEEMQQAYKNYDKLCNAIGESYINIVKPNQDHTQNIQRVDKKINLSVPDFNLNDYNSTDGLITAKKDILLATTNADCILLMFFDPVRKVIANVHSGWKGTLQRISVEAVRKMQKEYESCPEDIICCICPSIRKCHFEVEKDVEQLFRDEFKELNLELIIERKSEKKWNIDTVQINKEILKMAGLSEKNIIDSKICSVCNFDLIHSYRVEKEEYGLATAIIGLK